MDLKLRSRVKGVILLVATIVVFAMPHRQKPTVGYSVGDWVSPMTLIFDDLLQRATHRPKTHISMYDDLFRDVSLSMGNDWRLMAAIAYVESRFRYDARSSTGAVGLMQIMPRTGRHYGCDINMLLDPRINIMVANLLYDDIERMMDAPYDTSDRDHVSLILASYNGGIGHVFDAQRLTRVAGGDPHVWSDVVPHLLNLRFYDGYNKSVRNGTFATAMWTVRYVRDVMSKYDEYVALTHQERIHLYPYAIRFDAIYQGL